MTRELTRREQYGARTKAEAHRTAKTIAATLLQTYLDEGRPYDNANAGEVPEADCDRLAAAIDALMTKLEPIKRR